MIIGVPLSKFAYTPESYAYEKYLSAAGHTVQLSYDLDPDNDINIFFMGTRPFWKKQEGRAVEIHEYQSLSTPPYAKLKDFSKKIINRKPSGRIFLNDFVCKGLNFEDNISCIYRDMGVDDALYQTPSENPLYDIIYCGSVAGRVGLIEALLKLAKNYKVVVVGKVSEQEQMLLQVGNITLLGQVSRDQLPEIFRNARFGLNYTPDIYPFNIQTSTKTLEYLASGLGVISNRYRWMEGFSELHNLDVVWMDDTVPNVDVNIDKCDFGFSIYSWDNVLKNSKLLEFLESYV